ncbi:MAG: MerR family transcriptional regulator [Actinomycetota bacterium]|nr:MerR family transcriptional regulator [Actinomycetota bacterium]
MTTKNNGNGSKMLSIGQAVGQLKPAFPDLSISKVRFLEDEGLLRPRRTKGGYRLFSEEDIGRLTEILRLQGDQFLPLAVIKERMSGWHYGDNLVAEREGAVEEETDAEGKNLKPLSLDEVGARTGIEMETVRAMESFGLIKLIDYNDQLGIGPDDLEILTVFTDLRKFGIEARHLRMYENLAQRESLLFQQIFTPQIKHKSRKLRQKSLTDLRELVALTERIRRAMLKKTLAEANLL